MNCKRARLEVALWVGNDLDGKAEQVLKEHLAECGRCRIHWKRMKESLRHLHDPEDSAAYRIDSSIWPDLLSQLPTRGDGPRPVEFNGWLPATAVVAACLAIFAFWLNQSSRSGGQLASSPSVGNVVMPKSTFSSLDAGSPPGSFAVFHTSLPVNPRQQRIPVPQPFLPPELPLMETPYSLDPLGFGASPRTHGFHPVPPWGTTAPWQSRRSQQDASDH
ncbi:MAG: zf-HC2 domain-containing protein [Planctomycetes bacterium]|nr:zf-HC2 domain-containing protein [Planctomycetota bacterium]